MSAKAGGNDTMHGNIPASIFYDEAPQPLTQEQEALKRKIYDSMNPRRRKFVDRIGYAAWDPFQKPNDPLDLRTDVSKRTTQQLLNAFLRQAATRGPRSQAYSKGASECALGLVNRDEKYLGMFDFCLWYRDLLQKEGNLNEATLR